MVEFTESKARVRAAQAVNGAFGPGEILTSEVASQLEELIRNQ